MMKIIKFGILPLLFSGMLLACQNPFTNFDEMGKQTGIDSSTHGILSVSMNANSRAILPDTPEFTNYRLSFAPLDSQTAVDDIESTTGVFTGIVLEAGEWEISAYGYAEFRGQDFVIADASTVLTVEAGQGISESMILGTYQDGAEGDFSYSMVLTAGAGINKYDLLIQKMDGSEVHSVTAEDVETETASIEVDNVVSLDPGYYLVTAKAWNQDSVAVEMNVIHVYSNRQTSWDIVFSKSDLLKLITLSGNAEVFANGERIYQITMQVYTRPSMHWSSRIGSSFLDADTTTWSITTESLQEPTAVYFELSYRYAGRYFKSGIVHEQEIYKSDVSDIELVHSEDLIQINGTLELNVDTPDDLQNVELHFYLDENKPYWSRISSVGLNLDADGNENWSMYLQKFEEATTIYVSLEIRYDDDRYHIYFPDTLSLYNENKENIDLTADFILKTLSGTAQVSINGSSDVDNLRLMAYSNPDRDRWDHLINGVTVNPDGTWSMVLQNFEEPGSIYFTLTFRFEDSYYQAELPVGTEFHSDDVSDIELIYSGDTFQISGTLEHDLNDYFPYEPEVFMFAYYLDGSREVEIGGDEIAADGSWSMSLLAFDSETDIYFRFGAGFEDRFGYVMIDIEASVSVKDSDMADIGLNSETVKISGIFADAASESGIQMPYGLYFFKDDLDEDNVMWSSEESTPEWFIILSKTAADQHYFIALNVMDADGNELIFISEDAYTFGTSDVDNIVLDLDDMEFFMVRN
ncbi:hypothetical protein [Spirochaeta dissipatitropha]